MPETPQRPETTQRTSLLETFPNPHPPSAGAQSPNAQSRYSIEHHVNEFTSLCPKTGQPDFGQFVIRYVADQLCVELKSLKMYLQSYRDEGIFYEDVTNVILKDLVASTAPHWMEVVATWSVRGGIHSVIRAVHGTEPA